MIVSKFVRYIFYAAAEIRFLQNNGPCLKVNNEGLWQFSRKSITLETLIVSVALELISTSRSPTRTCRRLSQQDSRHTACTIGKEPLANFTCWTFSPMEH